MVTLTPQRALTARITREYRNAAEHTKHGGAIWYTNAHAIATRLADTYDLSVRTTSGVISALSPITEWNDNIRRAERALNQFHTLGSVTNGHTGNALTNVNAILNGADPDTLLRGMKTNAFYHAILSAGESGTAVIDRHAYALITNTRTNKAPTVKQYRIAAETFSRAARILHEPIHHVQATTWISWRDKYAFKKFA